MKFRKNPFGGSRPHKYGQAKRG